jgi:hypothetical protein
MQDTAHGVTHAHHEKLSTLLDDALDEHADDAVWRMQLAAGFVFVVVLALTGALFLGWWCVFKCLGDLPAEPQPGDRHSGGKGDRVWVRRGAAALGRQLSLDVHTRRQAAAARELHPVIEVEEHGMSRMSSQGDSQPDSPVFHGADGSEVNSMVGLLREGRASKDFLDKSPRGGMPGGSSAFY